MATTGATRSSSAARSTRVLRAPSDLPDDNPGSASPYEVGQFVHDNLELYYEIHGHGPRVLVFLHGILMDANMNRRLAADLAARGNRVILLDLPGHGLSARPQRASFHRMDTYAGHVVALLDHLGIDEAGAFVLQGGLEHPPHVGGARYAIALDAVGLGQLDEIRVIQLGAEITLAVDKLLPLAHHA